MNRLSCAWGTLVVLLNLARQAEAQYQFTPLEDINPLARNATPFSINNHGDIVGVDGTAPRGFLLSGNNYSIIGPPHGFAGLAGGINDSGAIVGNFVLHPTMTHGYLYSGGTYTLIDFPPPGAQTSPHGINNAGAIVGDYLSGTTRGFLLRDGSYTSFAPPGAIVTQASGINDSEQIVGVYRQESDHAYHGFLLSGGSYTTLDVPGATETVVGGINNEGQIAGYYTAGGSQHGFLFHDGSYTTVDVPGSTATVIWGMNDAGQIVGVYLDAASVGHNFVATPTPEPATFLLLSVAGVLLIAIARYRSRTAGIH